jgi:hypothetical protein
MVFSHQDDPAMARLTIALSDTRHKALKAAALQRGKTIGELIDESLEFYGIKSREDAVALVRRAREHSGLSETRAQVLAQDEVRAVRRSR